MSSTAFARSPRFFDLVDRATGRDVEAGAAAILARAFAATPGASTLFDAACGTGAYLERLGCTFEVAGIESDPIALQIARSREGRLNVEAGSLATYDAVRTYDVVLALRGEIARARSADRLAEAVRRLAAARAPGGVVIVEPFLSPERYEVGAIEAIHVDEPRVKIARAIVTKRVSNLAILDYNYLIATNAGVERHFERIERGLYARDAYEQAFEAAGLRVAVHADAAFPEGLLVGT